MSRHDHKVNLREIRERLNKLYPKPGGFDQLVMAERVELARTLCHDAFSLYQRNETKQDEKAAWEMAAELFSRTTSEAYSAEFWDDYNRLRDRDVSGLNSGITFLEIDPWFFGSGYVKADLLRFICRLSLSPEESRRLQNVVLAAIDSRDRREFRSYCNLARCVQDKEFRRNVEDRLLHQDPAVRRRARWALTAMTNGNPGNSP